MPVKFAEKRMKTGADLPERAIGCKIQVHGGMGDEALSKDPVAVLPGGCADHGSGMLPGGNGDPR